MIHGALGLDGAKGGWVGWLIQDQDIQPMVFISEDQLMVSLPMVELAFIDIPIGLSDRNHQRTCDSLLRKRLKARKSSVFPCPSRPAVYAADYQQACDLNVDITGKKISKQAWNICDKIRQIDALLQRNPSLKLGESHPEYLFQYLNDDQALRSSKKTTDGLTERLEIIARYHPKIRTALTESLPYRFGKIDDWIDAAILAIAANMAVKSGILTIPEPPLFDAEGRSMAIHYPRISGSIST